MKKFLLSLLVLSATSVSYAVEKVDTVLFIPGEAGNYELKVDTEKYPYLENKEVTWIAGFDEFEGKFDTDNDGTNEITLKVCAMEIDPSWIVTMNGKKYLHTEKIGNSWTEGLFEGAPSIRTLNLFYIHKISSKAVTDKFGTFYTKDDFENYTCDTTAILHIQKELKEDYVTFGFDGKGTTYKVGDTIKTKAKLTDKVTPLDIQKYSLITINKKDTTILAVSDSSTIEYIPVEDVKDMTVKVMVGNKIGYVTANSTKVLNVLPIFNVESLQYSVTTKNETYSKTEENVETIDVEVMNHDSLALIVNTNAEKSEYDLIYTWNKEGKSLPSEVICKDNIVSFSEFVKPDYDGVYNCIITDNETKEVLSEVSFIVKSEYPTSNENINVNNNNVKVINNTLYIENEVGKVKIYNTLGSLVKEYSVNGNLIVDLNLSSGIYFININKSNIKVLVK